MNASKNTYPININLNNYKLSNDDNEDDELPIIYLHGLPFSKTDWNEQKLLFDKQCILETLALKEKKLRSIEEISIIRNSPQNKVFVKSVYVKESLKNKKEVVDMLRKAVFANTQHIINMGVTALNGYKTE